MSPTQDCPLGRWLIFTLGARPGGEAIPLFSPPMCMCAGGRKIF